MSFLNPPISEEEYEENQKVIEEVNQLCFVMSGAWGAACSSVTLRDPKTKFWSSRRSQDVITWNMARAAWMHFRETEMDPQDMVYACENYRDSKQNEDPCFSDKASRNED